MAIFTTPQNPQNAALFTAKILTLHGDVGSVIDRTLHSVADTALILHTITSNSADVDNSVSRTHMQHMRFANLCPLDRGIRDATCITGQAHIITLVHCSYFGGSNDGIWTNCNQSTTHTSKRERT